MNKQIEELAKDIYEQKSCDTSFEENCKLLAYDLVTLGYQKVDKDKQIEQARKETAREILQRLFEEHNAFNENDVIVVWQVKEVLTEIAKQYGVEIKE